MIQICEIDYLPQHGYPKLDGQDGDESIVVEWLARNPVLPDYRTAFHDDRYPLFSQFSGLVLLRRACEPVGTDLFKIRVEYGNPGGDGTQIVLGGGSTVISTITNEPVDVPIAQHPNYRAKWNHELHGRGAATTPAGYDDQTHTALGGALAENYAWAKPGTVPAEGWRVLEAATKPGVEGYLAFLPVVHVVRTSSRKQLLERTMASDGTLQTPPETFGIAGMQWLQIGSDLVRSGPNWQLTTNYRGSKTIDPDIYQ